MVTPAPSTSQSLHHFLPRPTHLRGQSARAGPGLSVRWREGSSSNRRGPSPADSQQKPANTGVEEERETASLEAESRGEVKACIHTGKEAAWPSSSDRMKSPPPQQSGEGAEPLGGDSVDTQLTVGWGSISKSGKRSRGTGAHPRWQARGRSAGVRAAGRVRTTRCGSPCLPARLPRVPGRGRPAGPAPLNILARTLRVRR